jgi:hypothetical protein
MGKLLQFKKVSAPLRHRYRKLEKIKEELLRYHGIDLDSLMASEPATSLSVDQFDALTDRILETIDLFCEEHPATTVHDILYTIENVKEIIRETTESDE